MEKSRESKSVGYGRNFFRKNTVQCIFCHNWWEGKKGDIDDIYNIVFSNIEKLKKKIDKKIEDLEIKKTELEEENIDMKNLYDYLNEEKLASHNIRVGIEFAKKIFIFFIKNENEIKKIILENCKHKDIRNINNIDYAILCVSIAEIKMEKKIDGPILLNEAILINEAILMKRDFCPNTKTGFLNGVLSSIMTKECTEK